MVSFFRQDDIKPLITEQRGFVIFGLILLAFVLVTDILVYPRTLEDAFITFRYSDHLAEGYGLGAWNRTGERVEGYSTFLWMALMAGGRLAGIRPETFSKFLGILCHIALVFLPLLMIRNKARKTTELVWKNDDLLILTPLFLATYLPFSWYAVSGMEAPLFALLLGFCFFLPYFTRSRWPALTGSALLVLTRPEGVLLVVLIFLFHGWQLQRESRPKSQAYFGLAGALGAFAALTLSRWIVFHDLLPNTYYAKAYGAGQMHWDWGWDYVRHWIKGHTFWMVMLLGYLILLIWQTVKQRKPSLTPVFLFGLLFIYLFYIIKVGGDNQWAFPGWRHIVHIQPLVILLLGFGFVSLFKIPVLWRWIIAVAMILSTNYEVLTYKYSTFMPGDFRQGLADFPHLQHQPHNPYFYWLDDITGDTTSIASALGGELPYVVDAQHLDILGLNDRYVARHGRFDPEGPIDSKSCMSYIIEQQPDIIEFYFSGNRVNQGVARSGIVERRKLMANELLNDESFQMHYLFVVNAPYADLDRALFFHQAFYENHPQRERFEVIQALATSLYAGNGNPKDLSHQP